LEHDLPLCIFEDKVAVMRAGSAELKDVAALRKTDFIPNFLLSTAQGGQYETSTMDADRVKVRYQKLKTTPRASNDMTQKQLERKVEALERSAAEQNMIGGDVGGPHQMTNYNHAWKSLFTKFPKSSGPQKSTYRRNLMQVRRPPGSLALL